MACQRSDEVFNVIVCNEGSFHFFVFAAEVEASRYRAGIV
jgi:hypothetical protein